ncbi:MAG TPA: isocitrate lyase/phosphoenolpyruvate mutase family protein [Rhodocyclaceae bacterium]|nr:isocitrate lyase/phosphoenolpyruvate mutase family protein [Rhodocyclaceae bacterium]
MKSQQEKAEDFRRLHQGPCFIIPNPWDVGSARILASLGFPALASTGAGFAFSQGQPDFAPGMEAMLEHLRTLAAATDLPVSADLENGYGHTPEAVARTVRMAAECGVVGGSIEDATGDAAHPIYDLPIAVERIRSAAEAVRQLPFPFTLTARAENFLYGHPDLKDTIARLQAYQEAGADVLFAPGLQSAGDIANLVREVDRPVNVIMGFQGVQLDLAQLADLGVKRVSVGGSLARAAYGALLRAGRELKEQGTFCYANNAVSGKEMNALLASFASARS